MHTYPLPATYFAEIHRLAFADKRPWSAQEIEEVMTAPTSICISMAKGFVLSRVIACEGEILTIAIEPPWQNQGLGGTLLTLALEEMKNQGAQEVFIEVKKDDSRLVQFYQTHGFDEIALRRGYYRRSNGQLVDALIMRRHL